MESFSYHIKYLVHDVEHNSYSVSDLSCINAPAYKFFSWLAIILPLPLFEGSGVGYDQDRKIEKIMLW